MIVFEWSFLKPRDVGQSPAATPDAVLRQFSARGASSNIHDIAQPFRCRSMPQVKTIMRLGGINRRRAVEKLRQIV
jgi:hypothetical protein